MTPRTLPQNRKLSALAGEVARQFPLIPYRNVFAREAFKRYLIAQYVRDARLSAFYEGQPDPFPVRPVPSSELSSEQMSDLLAFCECWCAENGIALAK